MAAQFLLALVFAAVHVYATTAAFTRLELNDSDTSFLPRTLLMSTTLVFMMCVMWPEHGARVSLYYIFSYALMYTAVSTMYITREPIIGLLAVFAAILGVGQAIRTSPSWTSQFSPFIWAFVVFVLVFAFYTDDKYVDELADTFTLGEDIQDSVLPIGYLSGDSTILATPIVVAGIIGVFTYGYLSSAYKLQLVQ